jgi:Glycosyl hydrolases family 2, sugar binding domain/Glycosyl hydrolases family 2
MRKGMAPSLCGVVFALLASCGSSPEKGAHDGPAGSGGSGGTGDVLADGSGGGTADASSLGDSVGSGSPDRDGSAPPGPTADGAPDAGGLPSLPPSNRADVSLDDGWKFIGMDVPAASMPAFDDSTWTDVTLPHTWNISDGQTPTYYRGPGWYRRHYTVPSQYTGRRLYLQFDAASKVADVFVNGTHVGQHRGGNAIFRFDVTSLLVVGSDNILAVKVDNSAFPDVSPLSGDFTQFGGLYRDAHLLATDPVHIDVLDFASPGVFITPNNVSATSANLDVRIELVNDDTTPHAVDIEVDVIDAGMTVVRTLAMSQTLAPTAAGKNTSLTLGTTLASPHLWDGRADPTSTRSRSLSRRGASCATLWPSRPASGPTRWIRTRGSSSTDTIWICTASTGTKSA